VTYVLIHGGGSSARFWDRLVPRLDGPAVAVDLPGRGRKPADLATLTVGEESASVVADLEGSDIDDPVILVAHSSGGLVVPGVVAGYRGRIGAIVLNAALVPEEGGCGIDCMKPRHREGLLLTVAAAESEGRVVTLPGSPADPESFRTAYGGDPLDDETLSFVVDPVRCVEDTVHHYFQPVSWAGVSGIPIVYVINERDRPVATEAQEEMVGRLPDPLTVVRVDSGHLLPVTDPGRFADILVVVARSLPDQER
jgi:pimeloyl-ACP methyl ester carboxylesterase